MYRIPKGVRMVHGARMHATAATSTASTARAHLLRSGDLVEEVDVRASLHHHDGALRARRVGERSVRRGWLGPDEGCPQRRVRGRQVGGEGGGAAREGRAVGEGEGARLAREDIAHVKVQVRCGREACVARAAEQLARLDALPHAHAHGLLGQVVVPRVEPRRVPHRHVVRLGAVLC